MTSGISSSAPTYNTMEILSGGGREGDKGKKEYLGEIINKTDPTYGENH